MRPRDSACRLLCPRLARHLGLVLFVGLTACGSPSPEVPVSGPTSGSADAGVSSLAGAPRASLAARQAPTPDTRSTDAPRATRSVPAASPAIPPPSDAQTPADQAQRTAREQWFAEARESPDATVRLQALETWAQQQGDAIDSVLDALEDEDELVCERAEALWAQQLTQEEDGV